ncbi:MAG TPA: ribosome assembly factor SBDS, partial [Candidatus Thalassarchaeaceae archaeon]|nr:ribosome assembly factor SBDS [Candidatus Thalassarchaeaceae archaeon]
MVSLDDAVIARLEKGGNRYEILVDPELVTKWKENPESVDFEEMLATDEVWLDVKAGDRPTGDALVNIFGTTELRACVEKILTDGSIQLTTVQRKKMVSEKRKQIIHSISSTATDPKTRGPHPP